MERVAFASNSEKERIINAMKSITGLVAGILRNCNADAFGERIDVVRLSILKMNGIIKLKQQVMGFATEIFNEKDIDELYNFIVDTITVSYIGYYPEEAINHFIEYSNTKDIIEDAQNNYVIVIKDKNKIVATGTLRYTHIKRVFVSSNYQGKGFGKLIMSELEKKARENNLKLVELHSSLFAKQFYDSLNYKMFKIGKVVVENGELLYYQRMAKRLDENQNATQYNFHKKQFTVIKNDGVDVEVTTETVFNFYQNEELIYAEYKGGKVKYGEIFGRIENDTVHFYYSQVNYEGVKNQGSSIDEIKILENNKLQLIDRWEWKNKSGHGLCIMEENKTH
jgi:GNAT superfamily N-acetyltransferase